MSLPSNEMFLRNVYPGSQAERPTILRRHSDFSYRSAEAQSLPRSLTLTTSAKLLAFPCSSVQTGPTILLKQAELPSSPRVSSASQRSPLPWRASRLGTSRFAANIPPNSHQRISFRVKSPHHCHHHGSCHHPKGPHGPLLWTLLDSPMEVPPNHQDRS